MMIFFLNFRAQQSPKIINLFDKFKLLNASISNQSSIGLKVPIYPKLVHF